jgi:hypothetical protein
MRVSVNVEECLLQDPEQRLGTSRIDVRKAALALECHVQTGAAAKSRGKRPRGRAEVPIAQFDRIAQEGEAADFLIDLPRDLTDLVEQALIGDLTGQLP